MGHTNIVLVWYVVRYLVGPTLHWVERNPIPYCTVLGYRYGGQ